MCIRDRVLARLQAMGLDTGTAAPEALPAAKHIFSHIEWHMSGILLHVPAQDAPAGCVWASREALQAEYTPVSYTHLNRPGCCFRDRQGSR